jgi:hypothetical protein
MSTTCEFISSRLSDDERGRDGMRVAARGQRSGRGIWRRCEVRRWVANAQTLWLSSADWSFKRRLRGRRLKSEASPTASIAGSSPKAPRGALQSAIRSSATASIPIGCPFRSPRTFCSMTRYARAQQAFPRRSVLHGRRVSMATQPEPVSARPKQPKPHAAAHDARLEPTSTRSKQRSQYR